MPSVARTRPLPQPSSVTAPRFRGRGAIRWRRSVGPEVDGRQPAVTADVKTYLTSMDPAYVAATNPLVVSLDGAEVTLNRGEHFWLDLSDQRAAAGGK